MAGSARRPQAWLPPHRTTLSPQLGTREALWKRHHGASMFPCAPRSLGFHRGPLGGLFISVKLQACRSGRGPLKSLS